MDNRDFTSRMEEYIIDKFRGTTFTTSDDFSPFVKERSMRAVSHAICNLKEKGAIIKVGSVPIARGGSPRALYKHVGKKHEVVKTTYVDASELYAMQNEAQLRLQHALDAMVRA